MTIKNFHMSATNRQFLHAKIDQLDPMHIWLVNVTEAKSKRSIEQNSRLWGLYKALGEYFGHTADEMHQLMGYKFLRELKTINGESVEIIKSTTKLNTKQMTEYQEAIERWAADLGFIWEGEMAA